MVTIQGQRFCPDIGLIEQLLAENPGWGRSRLSVKLCELWDWRAANGQLKDMACRNLLLPTASECGWIDKNLKKQFTTASGFGWMGITN